MSEIPELEQALVGAARRHYRPGPAAAAGRARRRYARPLRIALPVLAVAAVVVAVVAIARIAEPPREEHAVTPAPTPDRLGHLFEVFARPRRASDALPKSAARSPRWETDRSRLVATIAGRRVFLVPSSTGGGRQALCIVTTAVTVTRASCALLDPNLGTRHLFTSWRPGATDAVAVFQDGVAKATLTVGNGDLVHRTVRDGAVALSSAVAVSWNDPAGRHHAESLAIPGRCPIFEPLPPDAVAQATRAAMDAQPLLYPGTRDPRVVRVTRLRRSARGGDLYRRCGEDTARRAMLVEVSMTPPTPSASLSQGALLAGQLDGRMTVWALLH